MPQTALKIQKGKLEITSPKFTASLLSSRICNSRLTPPGKRMAIVLNELHCFTSLLESIAYLYFKQNNVLLRNCLGDYMAYCILASMCVWKPVSKTACAANSTSHEPDCRFIEHGC